MRLIWYALLCLIIKPFEAQGGTLLPRGVAAFQYSYRHYMSAGQVFSSTGQKQNIAENYSSELSGESLLQGKGGEDLKRLANELKNFEGEGAPPLAEDLDLGRVYADASVSTDAHIFGFAYGISRHITFFAGVPWITSEVNATLLYDGRNNALKIKEELGNLAFADLQNGLDEASRLNQAKIEENIATYNYNPLGSWKKQAFGDIQIGAQIADRYRLSRGYEFTASFKPALSMPTGYVENSDTIQDYSFGKGYYSIPLTLEQELSYGRQLFLSARETYAINLPATARKRLPEGDETLVPSERTYELKLHPGDDLDLSAACGAKYKWFTTRYRRGFARHFVDRYGGSEVGNYSNLEKNTDTSQIYESLGLDLSTIEAYMQRRFTIPLIIGAEGYRAISGKNANIDQYFQLTLTSFFAPTMR